MTPSIHDIDLPQFVQADVVAVTGVVPATLQNWANRKLIVLSQQLHPGKASRRLYSAVDVVKVQAMVYLTGLGVSAAYASQIAERVIGLQFFEFRDYIANGADIAIGPFEQRTITIYSEGGQYYCLVSGNDLYFWVNDLHLDLIPPICIEIAFNELCARVCAALLDRLKDESPPPPVVTDGYRTFLRAFANALGQGQEKATQDKKQDEGKP